MKKISPQIALFRKRILRIALLAVIALLPAFALHAQSGKQPKRITLESFEFVGNSKTRTRVILRRLGLQLGDEISPQIIELGRQRLAHTNFFKEVSLYARPGSEKGKIVLIIEVKERKWPYFQFEGGHSELEGWYFVPASLRFDNLFGRGHRFGLKWRIGDHHNRLSLGYGTEFFDRLRFEAELFGGGTDYIHYLDGQRATHKVNSGGLALRLAGSRGLLKHVFLGLHSENYEPDDFALRQDDVKVQGADLPGSIMADLGRKELRSITLGLRLDTRDNSVYPLSGLWGAATAEITEDLDNKNAEFAKLTADARAYFPLDDTKVLAIHGKAAFVSEASPFYQRFYLGGANSLRGYADRRLTPEGWGTKLLLTNVEFRFPITRERFPYHKSSGVVFFDAGGIWQTGQVPRSEDFYSAVGVGVRVKFPVIGIVRFDFAFPINKIDENNYKFHLSLGHTF